LKTWREIKEQFLDEFTPKWGEREAMSQFHYILEHLTGEEKMNVSAERHVVFSELESVLSIIKRLKEDEPIQYITGKAWFDDLQFHVSPTVLIPRQETEELVYWIVNDHKNNPPKRILDIGTGSGSIAITLAKHFPQAEVVGWDISEQALDIAEKNKKELNVPNVTFKKVDVLAIEALDQAYDIVVSNPPYIPQKFSEQMESQVTKYEPELALFVPNEDPLLFYRTIAEIVSKSNNSNRASQLYFEINEFYKHETVELLSGIGFTSVKPKKDLNGNWRMVKAV